MSNILETYRRGRVQWLRFNRPEVLNALNSELLNALRDALEQASADPDVRVIALTGAGRAFSAGGDLKFVLGEVEEGATGPDGVATSVPAFTALRNCPKPVIAAVNGPAVAGGFELLLFCDVLFAAESATFADGHANYGLLPAGGGAAVLPRRIGPQRAKALLFSGDPVSAETMRDWGMVYQVVPDDQLQACVEQFCTKIAQKSPLVLQGMKEAANAALDHNEDLGLRHEMLLLRNHMSSKDFHEGLTAFTQKRAPVFEGR
ncbi:enoyl-CoA hydratase [Mycolicibacterium chitae]|uniref:Enoyl-CoA hydratase/isomerase n=2 Tax=Mycolicibacterium TaxID=1866885 RepID=A0A448I7E8_MYCCI|nr:enoyl-CoA hydratase/isomerase family protein [Mycolicibacterium chitae]MCV7109197.1 enoyl-CoA hydratase/isomerase family protein [Mycolicibacterium chitae]BBZ04815.1 enoyl-CoA hydratase [Mycolicibacterium chitae]VEG48441.1 enoyl-CoA hydratase/isomerase [Mycolicibacterium chitae]